LQIGTPDLEIARIAKWGGTDPVAGGPLGAKGSASKDRERIPDNDVSLRAI
jgi:hypothetical protein